jgi:hypothetical protein
MAESTEARATVPILRQLEERPPDLVIAPFRRLTAAVCFHSIPLTTGRARLARPEAQAA